jgi:hypothetical protein
MSKLFESIEIGCLLAGARWICSRSGILAAAPSRRVRSVAIVWRLRHRHRRVTSAALTLGLAVIVYFSERPDPSSPAPGAFGVVERGLVGIVRFHTAGYQGSRYEK